MINLNRDSKIDLHIHSNASDGTLSPEEIVKEAIEKGLKLISLTDHDEMKNTRKIQENALDNNIAFLPGIEISSTFNGNLYHILAYGTDNSNIELIELLQYNRDLLENRNNQSIKYLIDKGYNIDFLDYEKYKHDPKRGGWKALNYLIDKKICTDIHDYFNRLYSEEKHILYPIFSDTGNVINIIKKAGGIAILAHPYYEKDISPVDKKLNTFLEIGIHGVECFHPNHNQLIISECLKFCKENNLISTAGSDFHGRFISTRTIGYPEAKIKDVYVEPLFEYIKM